MLKYIDVLIGLAVVILFSSMAVTVLTQAATAILKSRGKALKQGITDLLQQIYPAFGPQIAGQLAEKILTHPLVREGEKELGTVIHREELTKIILELAAVDGPQKLEAGVQQQLTAALQANGITGDPKDIIKNIRATALQLELTHPELANNVRHSIAILEHASSDFVAKINGWFDQTIDRVSARFTGHTRLITFGNACIVALFMQLDSVTVLNRLAVDDALRNALVNQAKSLATPELQTQYLQSLKAEGLLWIPSSGGDWFTHWGWNHLPGIFVSMLLLNLGAPFWFATLKNLLQLRSLIAQKDDAQRQERQTQPSGAATT